LQPAILPAWFNINLQKGGVPAFAREATNYHSEMKSEIVKTWLTEQPLPHLDHESVIVPDNTSIRSVLIGKAPCAKHEELRHYTIAIQQTHSSHGLTNTPSVTAADSHE
jgi:hypothetical protein